MTDQQHRRRHAHRTVRRAESGIDVVLVTGLSGAGRGTAAKVLEDLGWYVADNLPPELIARMVDLGLAAGSRITQLAVVMDVRSRGFTGDLDWVRNELATRDIHPRVLFMEASDDILVRRYENNRRSHPLQGNQTLAEGIAAERAMLAPVRASADLVIDTSTLSVRALRESIERAFGGEAVAQTSVTVESFGFKYGLPMDADMVMDVRFLPNPHWVDELRPHTGQHPAVRDYVLSQPGAEEFLQTYHQLLRLVVDGYSREGKRYMTVAIGCTGGKHRSVAMAEALAGLLERQRAPVGAGAAPRSGSRMSPVESGIVALGGGHGLYATLSAARRLTPHVTAVVTVADDGGSSGRLRSELDIVPPGDLRMALAALASDSPHGRLWATIIQHRFGGSGALAGHPIGNLMLAGLNEVLADPVAALDELGRDPRRQGPGAADVPDRPADRSRRGRAGRRPADEPGDPRSGGGRHHPGQGAAGATAAGRPARHPAGRRRHHGRRSGGARTGLLVHQCDPARAGAGTGGGAESHHRAPGPGAQPGRRAGGDRRLLRRASFARSRPACAGFRRRRDHRRRRPCPV